MSFGSRRPVLTGLVAAAPATSAEPSFGRYVALGDSCTAGPLVPWQRASWCFRSTDNHPSGPATRLGLYDAPGGFTDVSCSSADTANMTAAQGTPSPDIRLSTQSPQFDAPTLDTDLVTIRIGGNDHGVFGSLVGTCPTLPAADPAGSPCQAHYPAGGVDTMTAAVQHTGRNLAKVIRGVREHSPGAEIVLVGYPRLVRPHGYCPPVVPLSDGDYAWAGQVERALNAAIESAAKQEKAQFADTYGPSLGHDACAGDPAWVAGQSTNLFAATAFPPYQPGMAAEAALITKALGVPAKTGAPTARDAARPDQVARMARTAGW
ncbi:SGNH/GDSL hydrolase family protein [Amycolatopsis sp. NPDC049252]|uniref:SGNH/GDSL hydrolase family protein n=1 Tax=Amycolatopsis sp. NPDC049252 TaxID=3363933 RepID=UPI0037150DB4